MDYTIHIKTMPPEGLVFATHVARVCDNDTGELLPEVSHPGRRRLLENVTKAIDNREREKAQARERQES